MSQSAPVVARAAVNQRRWRAAQTAMNQSTPACGRSRWRRSLTADGEQKMKRSLSIQRSLWLARRSSWGILWRRHGGGQCRRRCRSSLRARRGSRLPRDAGRARARDGPPGASDMPPPYFLSYCVQDNDMITIWPATERW